MTRPGNTSGEMTRPGKPAQPDQGQSMMTQSSSVMTEPHQGPGEMTNSDQADQGPSVVTKPDEPDLGQVSGEITKPTQLSDGITKNLSKNQI